TLALTHLDVAPRHRLLRCGRYLADGQVIERIPVGWDRDLDRQERTTHQLLRARPVYSQSPDDWPGTVAEALTASVCVLSYGPTALDKRLAPPRLGAYTATDDSRLDRQKAVRD